MIDRRDIAGLGVAIVGHAALIAGVLYLVPSAQKRSAPANAPIEVTLADEIGLVSAAPDPSDQPPDEARQGEEVPEDSEIAPPESEPDKKPEKPVPPATTSTVKPPPVQSSRSQRTQQNGGARKGLELDDATLRGNGPAKEETEGTGTKSQATMTGDALMNITTAVKRQVQPCADRQVSPAAEASQIIAVVQLRLKPDGRLESVRIVDHKGVNESNQRYVARVDDAVEAIFAGCTPIRGLPPELYDVPRGWRSLKFNYRLTN